MDERDTPELSKAQKKAIVALNLMGPDGFHARFEIACRARGEWGPGYPVRTMRILQRLGFAEPENEFVVKLVEARRCRCGCDAWRITEAGQEYVRSLDVRCTTGDRT
jgi:hypothetical protein